MSRITDYEITSRVTAEDALHDKLEVTLGRWILSAGTGAQISSDIFSEFIGHLTVPAEAIRLLPEQVEGFGLIFSRDTGMWRNYRRAKFRKSMQRIGENDIPAPLPNGFLKARLRTGSARSQFSMPATIECECELKLNATTYMRQTRMRQPRNPLLAPRADIFALPLAPVVRGEYSLDGKNNWLHPNSRNVVEWTPEQATAAPFRFVEAVQERIAFELQRTIEVVRGVYGHSLALLPSAPENNLKQIETYFEMLHAAPLQFVESMEAAALAYSHRVDVAFFAPELMETRSVCFLNSIREFICAYTPRLTGGCDLRFNTISMK